MQPYAKDIGYLATLDGSNWPQSKMFGAPKSMAVFVVSITLAVRTMPHLFVFAMDTRQCSIVFIPNWCGTYRPTSDIRAPSKRPLDHCPPEDVFSCSLIARRLNDDVGYFAKVCYSESPRRRIIALPKRHRTTMITAATTRQIMSRCMIFSTNA